VSMNCCGGRRAVSAGALKCVSAIALNVSRGFAAQIGGEPAGKCALGSDVSDPMGPNVSAALAAKCVAHDVRKCVSRLCRSNRENLRAAGELFVPQITLMNAD
jgi:hypothetical protein